MTWRFPVFIKDRDHRVPEVELYQSLDEIEGCLEAADIQNEEYLAWDADGRRLVLRVHHKGPHWLSLASPGPDDMEGLLTAVARYAEAAGVGAEELRDLTPCEAVRRIGEVQQRLEQERRKQRRWYHFRRRE